MPNMTRLLTSPTTKNYGFKRDKGEEKKQKKEGKKDEENSKMQGDLRIKLT